MQYAHVAGSEEVDLNQHHLIGFTDIVIHMYNCTDMYRIQMSSGFLEHFKKRLTGF